MPHVASVAQRVEPDDVPQAAGRLLNNAGRYLYERGRYAEAQALIERSLTLCERALGPTPPRMLHSASTAWRSRIGIGAGTTSRRRFTSAPSRFASARWDPTTSTWFAVHNCVVGQIGKHGRYAEAKALWERALESLGRTHGPDHPQGGHIINNGRS